MITIPTTAADLLAALDQAATAPEPAPAAWDVPLDGPAPEIDYSAAPVAWNEQLVAALAVRLAKAMIAADAAAAVAAGRALQQRLLSTPTPAERGPIKEGPAGPRWRSDYRGLRFRRGA